MIELPPALERAYIRVDKLTDVDVVNELRSIHQLAVFPWWWEIQAGSTDLEDSAAYALSVTVGPVTCLGWSEGQRQWLPVGGAGEGEIEARMAGLHTIYMEPGSQVAAETVFSALTEFLETRQRPTCVEWKPDEF